MNQQMIQTNWIERSIESCISLIEGKKMKLVTKQIDVSPYMVSFKRKKNYYIRFSARTKRKLHIKLQRYLNDLHRKRDGIGMPKVEVRPVYVPKRYMDEYLKICDLFCIPEEHIPEFRIYPKVVHRGNCKYRKLPQRMLIRIGLVSGQWGIGKKDGLPMTVVIHELLHALGYSHQDDINGYSKFGWNTGNDEFSRLICKDIYGIKEKIIR